MSPQTPQPELQPEPQPKQAQRMDLLLWRHAEAEDHTENDLERQLTDRGLKQARSVGRWILEHRPKQLRILVSPAIRTLQTAEALDLEFEINPQLSPAAAATDLIAAANWPAAGGAVLLVGHQPTLGRLAARLLTGKEMDLSIKKGALWWFVHDGADDDETVLKAVIPASLAR